MGGPAGSDRPAWRLPTCSEVYTYLKRWLVGDDTTLTDHVKLYLILGLVTANVDFSIPIMYMALGSYVESPSDVFDLYDTRFYFINQTLLFMPIICGYLTDYLGRYSHLVMVVSCVGLSVLQAMVLLPWDTIVGSEGCAASAADDGVALCTAQGILLAVFLVRGVFINQALDQMLKMLSVRASKQFPHDEERKEVEIQRTGTMSDACTSVVEGIVFFVAFNLEDYRQVQFFMTAVGCGTTLVVALLSATYTARSFTISRSEQTRVPVQNIAAKFTDDADSVAASVAGDRLLPSDLTRYGAADDFAGPARGGGVISGLSMMKLTGRTARSGDGDDDVVSDFREVRVGETGGDGVASEFRDVRVGSAADDDSPRSPLSPGGSGGPERRRKSSVGSGVRADEAVGAGPVRVAGSAMDDEDAVVCGQCLCCGTQCSGCAVGSRHTALGQFLSWLSGLCYFAVTPVIVLPFLAYLLTQLFNITVTLPVPQQEAAYFNLDDDLGLDDPGTDDGSDDALGPPGDPPASFIFRLGRVIRTVHGQFLYQSGIYLAGSGAYAAFIAEMRPFIFFRYAFPVLCAAVAALMTVYYFPSRSQDVSTLVVGLTQVTSYFMNEFLQWFLMAVVPESLFGLFTIAQGVGLALMGTVGSQLVRVPPATVIFLSQLLLGGAAFFSVLSSVVAYARLMRVEEEDDEDGEDGGGGSGKGASARGAAGRENDIMRTARTGGYQSPGGTAVRLPGREVEHLDDVADELFGDELEADAHAPPAASLSGYHHTG